MTTNSRPNDHPWSFILLLFFVFLASNLVGGFLATQIWGDVSDGLRDEQTLLDSTARQQLRWGQIVFHLFTFTICTFIVARLAYPKNWSGKLGLHSQLSGRGLSRSVALLLLSLPVVSVLQYLNLQVELPDAAAQQEALTNNLVRNILTGETTMEVITLFLTIAVVPAFGEELLFRGLIQGRILPLFLRNVHVQIILTGFFFSIMHLEMGGVLPRWGLGIVFGYAYAWSRNLWVPIFMHLAFNGLQALIIWQSGEFTSDTTVVALPQVAWLLAAVSLPLAIWLIVKQPLRNKTSEDQDTLN